MDKHSVNATGLSIWSCGRFSARSAAQLDFRAPAPHSIQSGSALALPPPGA
jgi:hypothetical protein